jgi:hypothetical protein
MLAGAETRSGPRQPGSNRQRGRWDTRFEMRSPVYTTRLDELMRVREG